MFRKGNSYKISVYLILGFLPLSVSFILAPFFTRAFNESEYGLLGLIGFFVHLFTVLIAVGLVGTSSRYYFHFYKSEVLKKTVYSTIIWLILIVFFSLFFILTFSGDFFFGLLLDEESFSFTTYGVWTYLTSFSAIINSIALAFYRNEENLRSFTIVSLSYFILSLTGNLVGVFILELGPWGSIAGRAIGGLIATVPVIWIFLKQGNFVFRSKLVRRLFAYALPLIPYGILLMLYESIDKILVERFFGLEDLGPYTLAYQISSILSVFIFAFFNAISPQINRLLSENRSNIEDTHLLQNAFLMLSAVLVALSIAFINPVVYTIINERYHGITQFLPILMVSYLGRAFYMSFSLYLFFYHKNAILNYINTIAILVEIAVVLLLSPVLGILSVYLGVFVVKNVQAALTVFWVKKMKLNSVNLKLFFKPYWLAVALTISVFVGFLLDLEELIKSLLPFLVLLLFLFVNKDYSLRLLKKLIKN